MIDETLPVDGDYNRDRNIKALKRRGFSNHGSTSIYTEWTRMLTRTGPLVGQMLTVAQKGLWGLPARYVGHMTQDYCYPHW